MRAGKRKSHGTFCHFSRTASFGQLDTVKSDLHNYKTLTLDSFVADFTMLSSLFGAFVNTLSETCVTFEYPRKVVRPTLTDSRHPGEVEICIQYEGDYYP